MSQNSDKVVDIFARSPRSGAGVHEQLGEPELPLFGGGGGGTLPPMVPIKDYVDKADEAIESRLTAKLDLLATKADVSASQQSIRANIWGAIAAGLGIVLAVLAFATNRFDTGMTARASYDPIVSAQKQRDEAQDKKFDEILRRLPAAEKARSSK